jgi:hypothetical protein
VTTICRFLSLAFLDSDHAVAFNRQVSERRSHRRRCQY